METVGIEQRKLDLISQLVRTEDAEVIEKIEMLLSETYDRTFQVSEEDLKYRAGKALDDIASGNVLSQEDAERESRNW